MARPPYVQWQGEVGTADQPFFDLPRGVVRHEAEARMSAHPPRQISFLIPGQDVLLSSSVDVKPKTTLHEMRK